MDFSGTKTIYWNISNFSKASLDSIEEMQTFKSGEFIIFAGDIDTRWDIAIGITKTNISATFKGKVPCSRFHFKYAAEIQLNDKKIDMERRLGLRTRSHHYTKTFYTSTILKDSQKYLKSRDTLMMAFRIDISDSSEKTLVEECKNGCDCDQCETIAERNFINNFDYLLYSENFSDVKFVCSDEKEIPAHQNILAARSPVFKAMFETQMLESTTRVVKLDDIDSETMKEILRYMYVMDVEGLRRLAPKILYGAEKYDLIDLKEMCEESMIKNIKVDNVIEFFILANRFAADKLSDKCVKFIQENYDEVRCHESWAQLYGNLFSIITDSFARNSKSQSMNFHSMINGHRRFSSCCEFPKHHRL